MELKIQSERVIEAAKSCPAADEVLRKLFPEVFEQEKEFDPKKWSINTSSKDHVMIEYGGVRVLYINEGGVQGYNLSHCEELPFKTMEGIYGTLDSNKGRIIHSSLRERR